MKQVRDHYFREAKREGYAARSVYKLEEIDRRRGLLRPGLRVLDLGSAPGSWLQYAAERVGRQGRVVGVDLQPIRQALPPNVTVIEGDVFELPPERLMDAGGRFHIVLSDMAPNTTGIPSADAARSARLVARALELAQAVVEPGGALLAKAFQGAELPALRAAFGQAFETVTLEKPKASRSESVEIFLLGRGRR
ncbi:MAG: RlmE family RNA methyltransferase [Candidatus Lambdaproteobacteria bacterium]|nr:RlmE family RNA methyltransferase [Candidatus Lambdaproteobacteria bacterium]